MFPTRARRLECGRAQQPPAIAGRRIIELPLTRRLEAFERADVLAADVDVHERRQAARLEELRLERRIAAREILEHLAHRLALADQLALAADLVAERGWNPNLGHPRTPWQNST